MDDVKVSIIVPVYNVAEYLDECMISLVNQSLKDIEILCVNDGSTDNSLEILEEFYINNMPKRIQESQFLQLKIAGYHRHVIMV